MLFQVYNIEKSGKNEVILYGKEIGNFEDQIHPIVVRKIFSDVYFLPVDGSREVLETEIKNAFGSTIKSISFREMKNIFYRDFDQILHMIRVSFNHSPSIILNNFISDNCRLVLSEFNNGVENLIISKKLKGPCVVEITERKGQCAFGDLKYASEADLSKLKIVSLSVNSRGNNQVSFSIYDGETIISRENSTFDILNTIIKGLVIDLLVIHNFHIRKHVHNIHFLLCDLFEFSQATDKGRSFSIEELCMKYQINYIEGVENESKILYDLFFQMDALSLAKEISAISGNQLNRCFMNQRAENVEYALLHELFSNNYLLPCENRQNQAQKYEGGLVLEPLRSYYPNIVVLLDFTSLYPSIIQEYSVCFSTIDFLVKKEKVENKVLFLPNVLKKFVGIRNEIKEKIKQTEDPVERNNLNIKQKVTKLMANSIYGSLGFVNSRFCNYKMASYITEKGREILNSAVRNANALSLRVIYGDTDSIMIHTSYPGNRENISLAISSANKLRDSINKMFKIIAIKIEGCYLKLLLYTKKKYAGLVYNSSTDTTSIDLKGVDIVRRDFCKASQFLCMEVLKIILEDPDENRKKEQNIPELIYTLCSNFYNNLTNLSVSEFIISSVLNKELSSYSSSASLPHINLALRLQANGTMFYPGDFVSYVIGKGEGLVSHRAYSPRESFAIDYDHYIKAQILPSLFRIIDLLPEVKVNHISLIFNIRKQQQPSTTVSEMPKFVTSCCKFTQEKNSKCRNCGKPLDSEFYFLQILSIIKNHPIHQNYQASCVSCNLVYTNGVMKCLVCKGKLLYKDHRKDFDNLLCSIEKTFADNLKIQGVCKMYNKHSGYRTIDLADYFVEEIERSVKFYT